MATRRERVYYELTATDGASRVFRQVEGSARSLAGGYQTIQAAVGVLASGAFVRGMVNAVVQGEQAQNRLTAALRATGNQVGITRAELDEMADAMAESTQFDDEGLRNAQAQLAKFGNIQGDVFRGAMKAAADWAAFMGTDVADAAQQIGRALQSPTEGLRIIERQVGKLTEAEEKHIQTLAEQGRAVEAQRAVLDLLEKKVGGTAQTMNTDLTKATSDFSKEWNELLETLGRSGTIMNETIGGGATLMRDMRKELQGVRTPLRDLADDSLEWLTVLRFVPGAISMIGHAARDAQLRLDKQRRTVSGRIRNPALEDIGAFEAGLAATPAVPITLGGDIGDKNKAARLAAKKLAEERQLQQDIQAAGRSQLAAERESLFTDPALLERQIAGIGKLTEEQKRLTAAIVESAELSVQAADDMVYGWDQFGNRVEMTREAFEALEDAAEKAKATGIELGWAFSSAFENAIIEGGKLRDVFQGLAKDVARIVLRQAVTQPMANAIAGALGGMFGGARAEGGPVMAGRAYLVGERGPELFMPRQGGQIAANGGGVTVNISMPFSANTPAAVRDAVMSAAPMLTEAAKRGVFEARARGSG